ncbi:hypothetical protein H8959_005656 [Pygathrix nigripes]
MLRSRPIQGGGRCYMMFDQTSNTSKLEFQEDLVAVKDWSKDVSEEASTRAPDEKWFCHNNSKHPDIGKKSDAGYPASTEGRHQAKGAAQDPARQQDPERRGERCPAFGTERAGERGATPTRPPELPCPTPRKGHATAAPLPRTGTDGRADPGPLHNLPARRPGPPREPGETRTRQQRQDFPGNAPSQPPRARPRPAALSPTPPRPCPPSQRRRGPRSGAVSGSAGGRYSGRPGRGRHSPQAAAAPSLRLRQARSAKAPAAPSWPGTPASSSLRPAALPAQLRTRGHGWTGARGWRAGVGPDRPCASPPPPPPPPPEFGALLQCLRG